MSAQDTSLQKPDSNRHITPYEDAALPIGPFCNSSGYRSRTCYLRRMRPAVVFRSTHPQSPNPGIEPGSSAWRTDVLAVTPHGQQASNGTRTRKFALAERCVANYAILAYESFPSDSNRQPADYETAALPLRQRSFIGAAGIEPASSAYKTGALPLDEAPETGTAGFEPAAFRLTAGRSAS